MCGVEARGGANDGSLMICSCIIAITCRCREAEKYVV